jgi:arylsulfatase
MGARTSLTLYPGMTGMMENTFLNVKGHSISTAEVDIPQSGANGVTLAQGGRFGGWSLYLKDGKPAYAYNWVGLERYTVAASDPLATGKATISVDFVYDGGGRGQGGTVALSVNGKKIAEGRIAKTNAFVFSLDEGADVGMDEDTPVTEVYQAGPNSRFTGKIDKVTVQVR